MKCLHRASLVRTWRALRGTEDSCRWWHSCYPVLMSLAAGAELDQNPGLCLKAAHTHSQPHPGLPARQTVGPEPPFSCLVRT